jgi:hypothetical protein
MYLKVGKFFDLNFFRSNKLRKDQWGDMCNIAYSLKDKNDYKEEYIVNEELKKKYDEIKIENNIHIV